MFNKILIANRGEIAVRIIRACRELGIKTVAIYSETDSNSLHVLLADEAYPLNSNPKTAYLDVKEILRIAERAQVDAIHPGYGFLSQNPKFAELVEKEGFTFIGPRAENIKLAGDKVFARKVAEKAGLKIIPGSHGALRSLKAAIKVSEKVGYPVIIKAALGGGGLGMRIVWNDEELTRVFNIAREEAKRGFGVGKIYIEKYLPNSRHIEFQIVADNYGNIIHLGERECSIQRRYQKLIEESPSVVVDEETRSRIGELAVRFAERTGYTNVGTVEFLYNDGEFFFIEMNTRLQVEHGVTEMVTGLDLVKMQIQIAGDKPLDIDQRDVSLRGWAMEVRINAEDPLQDFAPSPGKITDYREPGGPGVRVDSGVYEGFEVSDLYNPLIAKLIVWGRDRSEVISRLKRSLKEYVISEIKTTIPLYLKIVEDPDFISGNITTEYLIRKMPLFKESIEEEALNIAAAIAIAVTETKLPITPMPIAAEKSSGRKTLKKVPSGFSPWYLMKWLKRVR